MAIRIYGEDHYLVKEIAHHTEPNEINGNHQEMCFMFKLRFDLL